MSDFDIQSIQSVSQQSTNRQLSRNSTINQSTNSFLDNNQSFDLITKQFENLNITIYGTNENPLFLGKDIAKILEIGNIREKTREFDERYKVVRKMDTFGGLQNQAFYTTKGVYRLAFMSKKEGAIKFQEWVADVIEDVRLKGSYELRQQNLIYQQKQLEYQQKEIEYQKQIKKQEKQLEEKNKYVDIPLLGKIYIGQEFKDTDEYWKVGCKEKKSKRKDQQQNSHTHGYGHFHIQPCINETHLEKQIHHVLEKQDYHHRGEIYHCKYDFIKAVTRILGSTFDVLYKSRWQMTEQDIRNKINERLDEGKEVTEDSFVQQDQNGENEEDEYSIVEQNENSNQVNNQQDTDIQQVNININQQQLNEFYEQKIEFTDSILDQIKKDELFREYNKYTDQNLSFNRSANYLLIDELENYLKKNKKNAKYQNRVNNISTRGYLYCRFKQ